MPGTLFDIDFASIVNFLLPVRLRQAVANSWLNALVQPVKDVYGLFTQRRNDTLYLLAHNSQVAYLQSALNDIFDGGLRRIYIADGVNADPDYLFLIAEEHPLWLGLQSEAGTTAYQDPLWLYTNAETSVSGVMFTVMVPADIIFDITRMQALVDKYRLASKSNYAINTF